MSKADEITHTGQTVLDYIASKRRLATLQMAVSRLTQRFDEYGSALRDRASDPAITNEFLGMPTYEELRSLLEDLRSETLRFDALSKSLRAIGLEI